jgi:ribokinase
MTPIYVIGSSNTDMVVHCRKIPAPGETILGGTFFMNPGGKGANQAVAAARLGSSVTLVANVGNDLFGRESIDHFRKENVNTNFISTDPELASGVALINVDHQGENSITVAPGSNGNLNITQVDKALKSITGKAIVLIQLEIPLTTVEHAILFCNKNGHHVILNPAPAQRLNEEIFKNLFLITPNETEAELLTGISVTDNASAVRAAEKLHQTGIENIVITLGAKGAYLHSKDTKQFVTSPLVKAIDSTAAGDCFNGALAVALSENRPLYEAVSFGCAAASLSVTRMGAQSSMPSRLEVDNIKNLEPRT